MSLDVIITTSAIAQSQEVLSVTRLNTLHVSSISPCNPSQLTAR